MTRLALIAGWFAAAVLGLVVILRPDCVTDCLAERLDEARECNGIWTEGLR